MTGLRALLRIARRDAARARGRSTLIVVMIALPVFAAVFADVLARTAEPDPDEVVTRTLGATDYRLRAEHVPGAGYMQAPDPTEGAVADGPGPAGGARRVDVRDLVPPGSRVLTEASTTVDVATRAGRTSVAWEEVTAADPAFAGRFEVLSGRAPARREEVLATPEVLERTGTGLGERLRVAGHGSFAVVGTVRQSGILGATTVYALPGTLLEIAPGSDDEPAVSAYVAGGPTMTWARVRELNDRGVSVYDRRIVLDPPPRDQVPFHAATGVAEAGADVLFTLIAGVLLVTLAGLEVVLLAGAAFAVGARRQARSLALLAATGATSRQVRLVVLAGGLVLGAVGAVAGTVAGVAAAALARPAIEGMTDTAFARFDVRPLELLAIGVVALVTGVLAAVVPSRTAARQDVVAALAGRRGRAAPSRRTPVIGLALAATGAAAATVGSLWGAAQPAGGSSGASQLIAAFIAGGAVLVVAGLVILSPSIIALVARLGPRLPPAARLVVRDAARHRMRSGPAMAAVLAAVAGSAALTLVVAATDERDRRSYTPQIPAQTAGVTLEAFVDRPGAEPRRVRIDPAAVDRAVRPHLPVRRSAVVPQLGGCSERTCTSAAIIVPPASACGSAGDPATACAPAPSRWNIGTGGLAIGGPELLERLYGIDDRRARAALTAGGAVVLDRALVRDGMVTMEVSDGDRTRQVRLPAVAADAGAPSADAILSPAAADRIGVDASPGFVAFALTRVPTRDEEDAAVAALDAAGIDAPLTVERGYTSDYGPGLLALVLAAAAVTLGAAGIATGLAQADARPDHATLAAIGAEPRLRRTLAALQALLIAGLGTSLGIAAGFVPALALIGAIPTLDLVLPWVALGCVLVLLPLLAAAGAWALTRSRLPMSRRVHA